jgi:tetratricopeptide (TPR) repeat protein
MAELLQALTPNAAAVPYRFRATGISVFSFEEALYHCYHYWKQSADECLSEGFITWAHTALGLSQIAARLREISKIENFTERYCSFLAVTPYFPDKKINALKKELGEWENRLEWEKLKERGDYFMENNEYAKAFSFYSNALLSSENPYVLNNAAVSLMKQARFAEASEYFERAMDSSPNGDVCFSLNYIESLIFGALYDKAWLAIGKVEASQTAELSEILYFKGEINFRLKHYYSSVPFFDKAIQIEESQGKDASHYIHRLCDVYIKLRQFDLALALINRSKTKDKGFYKKQAEIHAACGNIPAAIRSIEAALMTERGSADLWTRLAAYYRLEYNFPKASSAIAAALNINPNNPHVKLEHARVNKAQGLTKKYQTTLSEILSDFKSIYREEY